MYAQIIYHDTLILGCILIFVAGTAMERQLMCGNVPGFSNETWLAVESNMY